MAPTSESVQAVNEWLLANNLTATPISSSGDWLSVELPVRTANELFSAEFSVAPQLNTGRTAIRTPSYTIPLGLQGHIDLVHPITSSVRVSTQTAQSILTCASWTALPLLHPAAAVPVWCYRTLPVQLLLPQQFTNAVHWTKPVETAQCPPVCKSCTTFRRHPLSTKTTGWA